jgi:hypothetical protein
MTAVPIKLKPIVVNFCKIPARSVKPPTSGLGLW